MVNVMYIVVLLNCLYKSLEREEYNNDKKIIIKYIVNWVWIECNYIMIRFCFL